MNSPLLRTSMTTFAHSGDTVVWLLVGGMFWFWNEAAVRALGIRIWMTVLVSALLSTTLKFLVRRQRPAMPARGFYHAFDRYSFPSGHAVRVGALTVVLGAALPVGGALALAIWGLLVCVSRIALQVHFFSDVGAGLMLGWLAGALLLLGGV